MKKVIAFAVAGLIAAAISGEICQSMSRDPVRYEGVEPGWSYMHVLAGGWPLQFIFDGIGLSPGNHVSLLGALLGNDKFRAAPFLADAVFYAVLFWAIFASVRWFRAR
ncbi:MAG TPA: hypothetical protein VE010_09160 [Thermoanaerobaculia bacterium]|nr:hypothetical protein [Thermoanaerobaculia bacterium]